MSKASKDTDDEKAPARRAAWLWQVMADRGLSPQAFRVAWIIAEKWNPNSGIAWPAQPWLAEQTGTDERSVRRSIAKLQSRGHLSCTVKRGRGFYNEYRLLFKDRTAASGIDPEIPDASDLFSDAENRTAESGIASPKPDTNVRLPKAGNRTPASKKTGHQRPENLIR